MKFFLVFLGFGFILSGCVAGMPNYITENVSSFDGTKELVMEPGFIYKNKSSLSGSDLKLGLQWNSKMGDKVIIVAEVQNSFVNIDSKDGLLLNIEGEILSLSSSEVFTNFDTEKGGQIYYSKSTKRFPADLSIVKRMINSENVMVKLMTSDGYLEGDFQSNHPSAAIRGFSSFIEKIGI